MSKPHRIFYGWLVVLVGAIGLFLGAPLTVFSFSVFFKSLAADFHASRAAVSFSFSLFNFIGALWLPGTGSLIDRFGAKRVILISTLAFGLVLCSAWWVGGSLWQLYLFFAVLGIAMASGPAPVPYGAVISHWFDRRRGLAMALTMMGIGIGSIVVPMLVQRLLAAHGWRITFAIFGVAVLLLPFPVIAAWLKDDPSECGLHPDGDAMARSSPHRSQEQTGDHWREIWRSPTFWNLVCIFILTGAAVHGSALHMSAILTDRGVTAERAALATSLVGAAVIVGRLTSGYLLDRVFAPHVAIFFYGATAVGIAMLATGTAGPLALLAAFLSGLGMGAEVESMGYMVSRYFGLRAFGVAYGVAFGAFMIAGSAGVLWMGAGYDRFHSYTVPLVTLCAAVVLALVLLSRLGAYRYMAEPAEKQADEPMVLPV
ncbi:MAG TPA: MFS transporter [Acidobacteriaceae bacterium]|nr:MFS transporter [Acidobacteriaceae bacterium]